MKYTNMETKNKMVYVQPTMAVVEVEVNRSLLLNTSSVNLSDWSSESDDNIDEEM